MDFSSLNPNSTNGLNLAARQNDVAAVKRLLKQINPNCIDNRGWTSLHEAAAADSYESLLLLLKHRDCRPLAETHEGHTALYLACRYGSSIRTIQALLDSDEEIVHYGSLENVTPLHVVSGLGRLDVMQLLIDYGAMLNTQDFDGDTPLHDATLEKRHEAVSLLLHAGAIANVKNTGKFTPLHLACSKGCLKTVQSLLPFVSDINETSRHKDTVLMLAVAGGNDNVITYLLENGADPHVKNSHNHLPLHSSMLAGNTTMFKILFAVTDKSKIDRNIVYLACRPHNFNLDILEQLLVSDLGPEFFQTSPPFYEKSARIDMCPLYITMNPLSTFLDICEYVYQSSPEKFREFFYLFLLRGGTVNVSDVNECPPLVYIHYRPHSHCFDELFQMLLDQGCNVDYHSLCSCNTRDNCIPDAFVGSMVLDPRTLPKMIPYSLRCEPEFILGYAQRKSRELTAMPMKIEQELVLMVDSSYHSMTSRHLPHYVPCLKHLCRRVIRRSLRRKFRVTTTTNFLAIISRLPLPNQLKLYLRYLQ